MSPSQIDNLTSNKYGFKVRKREAPTKQRPTSPKCKPKSLASRKETTKSVEPAHEHMQAMQNARKAWRKREAQAEKRRALRNTDCRIGTTLAPIKVEDYISIREEAEPDGSASNPIVISDHSNPGLMTTSSSMTWIESMQYQCRKLKEAEIGELEPENRVGSKSGSNGLPFETHDDESWIEHDNIGEVDNDDDNEDNESSVKNHAISRVTSPCPDTFRSLSSLQLTEKELSMFDRAIHSNMFVHGYEDMEALVKLANHIYSDNWGSFRPGVPILALQELEKMGKIRLYEGKVYFPEAFHLLPTQIKPEPEFDDSEDDIPLASIRSRQRVSVERASSQPKAAVLKNVRDKNFSSRALGAVAQSSAAQSGLRNGADSSEDDIPLAQLRSRH